MPPGKNQKCSFVKWGIEDHIQYFLRIPIEKVCHQTYKIKDHPKRVGFVSSLSGHAKKEMAWVDSL